MKTIKKLLNTEKGVGAFLLIGINCLYSIVGYALYVTIGPIAGIIPVATGLGLTGVFLIPRLINIDNNQQSLNCESNEVEEMFSLEESITTIKENTITKDNSIEKSTYLSEPIKETSSVQENAKSKVLVKSYIKLKEEI